MVEYLIGYPQCRGGIAKLSEIVENLTTMKLPLQTATIEAQSE